AVSLCFAQESKTCSASEAAKHGGETAMLTDKVANVFESKVGNTFLNFGARYPNQVFTAFNTEGFSRPIPERERAGWPHCVGHGARSFFTRANLRSCPITRRC